MTRPAPSIAVLLEKKDTDILEKDSLIAVNLREARANFSRLLMSVKYDKNRFVITQHGEPAAVLMPIRDYREFERLDSIEENPAGVSDYVEIGHEEIRQRGIKIGEGEQSGKPRKRTKP